MEIIRPGLGGDHYLSPAVITVLSIEIARQHPEILNGVEIRNERRAHVEIFLHIASIEAETIAGFPLSANREVARIQISRRRSAGAARHDHGVGLPGAGGNDPWLEGKQIGEAPPI